MFILNLESGTIRRKRKDIELTKKEIEILKILKDFKIHGDYEIMQSIYGDDAELYEVTVLRVIMCRLKKKTEIKIQRKSGLGYKLIEEYKEI